MRSLRIAAGLAAVGLVAATLLHPGFRTPAGAVAGAIAIPLGAAATLLLAALTSSRGSLPFLAMSGLFLVGQGVLLQLAQAGAQVGYQHWLLPGEMPVAGRLWLGFQAVIVTGVAWRRRADVRRALSPRAGAFRLGLVGVVFVLASAAPSRSLPLYGAELALATALQLLQLASLTLALLVMPADAKERARAWAGRLVAGGRGAAWRRGPDPYPWVGAAWALLVAALLSVFVYERFPHIPDEIGYLMQARTFRAGLLSLPPPPVPEAFRYDMFALEGGRWYSSLPPAWPLVLGLGVMAGVPWLVNPVLTGVNVLLAYALVRSLYGRRRARIVVLLLCLSPWFLFMGMNFMNHQWAMTCALVAALGLRAVAASERTRWLPAAAAGLALATLAAIRPLEALATALTLGLLALAAGRRHGWRAVAGLGVAAAVAVLASLPQFAYNRHFTGRAGRFPVMEFLEAEYGAGTNALGFGANRGFGWTGLDPFPGHGAADVALNTVLNLSQVNLELLGWGIGSVLILTLFLALRRKKPADLAMIAVIAAVIIAHAFYWFSGGPDFGARYWYLILLPCLVLTARGLPLLSRLTGIGRHGGLIAAFALSASALFTFMPWRAADKYHGYRGLHPDMERLAAETGFGRALVLVRGPRWPDFISAAILNPLDVSADTTIYAWDAGPQVREALLRAYAGRSVWVVEGPSLTGAGYRVVSGPVPAAR